jgi:hypothetical protein
MLRVKLMDFIDCGATREAISGDRQVWVAKTGMAKITLERDVQVLFICAGVT